MKLPYGFTLDQHGNVPLDEQKANVVRLIYQSYLSGLSLAGLSEMLAERHIPSQTGKERWTPTMLDKLLSNRKYVAVVGMEQYLIAQAERTQRLKTDINGKRKAARYDSRNVLSGLLICAECGRSYRRVKRSSDEIVWRCANRVELGRRLCKSSPTITEEEVIRFVCEMLGIEELDPQAVREGIELITVRRDGSLPPKLKPPLPLMEFCH